MWILHNNYLHDESSLFYFTSVFKTYLRSLWCFEPLTWMSALSLSETIAVLGGAFLGVYLLCTLWSFCSGVRRKKCWKTLWDLKHMQRSWQKCTQTGMSLKQRTLNTSCSLPSEYQWLVWHNTNGLLQRNERQHRKSSRGQSKVWMSSVNSLIFCETWITTIIMLPAWTCEALMSVQDPRIVLQTSLACNSKRG